MDGERSEIAGILLAAGAGRRFGGDKLLHPMDDGVAIAAHAARNLLAAVPDVVAVVRWGDFPLYEILEEEGCRVTMFRGAARGMGASLAHGVAQARGAAGWVVALADMPRIGPQTVRAVAAALRGGAPLVAPAFRGERGHPVGFAARFRDELAALNDDEGARGVLARHRDDLRLIACEDPAVLLDIDAPADLEHLRRDGQRE
ncbi:MAG: nucleotidyltransferase family protein [Burkholderiales bacterium]|nr:nucleotidyltransferase family protein [Burkholderiales bacterium]